MTAGGPLRPYGAPPLGTGRKFRAEQIQRSRIRVAPICSPFWGSSREAGEGFPSQQPHPPRPHRHSRAPSVIPAPPPSFPRRRESIQDQHQLPESQSSSRVSLRHGPAGPSAVRVRVSNQAQTKIHGQGAMQRPTGWIPACAGMTERRPTTTDHSQPPPTTLQTTKPSNSRHITPIFPTPPPRKKFPANHQPPDAAAGPLRPFGAPPLGTGRKFRTEQILQRSRIRVDSICSPCKGSSREAGEGFPSQQPHPRAPSVIPAQAGIHPGPTSTGRRPRRCQMVRRPTVRGRVWRRGCPRPFRSPPARAGGDAEACPALDAGAEGGPQRNHPAGWSGRPPFSLRQLPPEGGSADPPSVAARQLPPEGGSAERPSARVHETVAAATSDSRSGDCCASVILTIEAR